MQLKRWGPSWQRHCSMWAKACWIRPCLAWACLVQALIARARLRVCQYDMDYLERMSNLTTPRGIVTEIHCGETVVVLLVVCLMSPGTAPHSDVNQWGRCARAKTPTSS